MTNKIIKRVMGLTIEEALKDGGLWFDGSYLWFRQIRLGKIIVNKRVIE